MIDFFNSTCSEAAIKHVKFGLCDDQNSTKAYSDITDESKWIAVVSNNNGVSVQFTPIDNCMGIKKDGSNELESTCDGMLIFGESIYLVELKDQRSNWLPDAIEQLINTIKLLKKCNRDKLNLIRFKKAFACNKKRSSFVVIDVERKKRFYDETNFRLDAQARIIIK